MVTFFIDKPPRQTTRSYKSLWMIVVNGMSNYCPESEEQIMKTRGRTRSDLFREPFCLKTERLDISSVAGIQWRGGFSLVFSATSA